MLGFKQQIVIKLIRISIVQYEKCADVERLVVFCLLATC